MGGPEVVRSRTVLRGLAHPPGGAMKPAPGSQWWVGFMRTACLGCPKKNVVCRKVDSSDYNVNARCRTLVDEDDSTIRNLEVVFRDGARGGVRP